MILGRPAEFAYPRVGIGVCVFKEGRVPLGKRKGSHGAALYAFPGGSLEYGETIAEGAAREVFEEAGIVITNIRFICIQDLLSFLPKHYVDIGVAADWASGDPVVREPEKCEEWAWYDRHSIPEPLFPTIPRYFEAMATGKNYFGPSR